MNAINHDPEAHWQWQKPGNWRLTPARAMDLMQRRKSTEDLSRAPSQLHGNLDSNVDFHDDEVDPFRDDPDEELQYDDRDIDSREGYFLFLSKMFGIRRGDESTLWQYSSK